MSDVDYEFLEYCRKYEYSRKKYASWKRLDFCESIDVETILEEARSHFRDPLAKVSITLGSYYDESWLDLGVHYLEEESVFLDRITNIYNKNKKAQQSRIKRKLDKVQARQALENEYGPYIKN